MDVLMILFMLVCAIGTCIDIFIYFKLRSRRMRTVPNTFIASWIIAQTLYLLCVIIIYILLDITSNSGATLAAIVIFNVLTNLTAIFYHTMMLSVFVTLIDWFLAAYFQKVSESFRKYCTHAIGSVWTLSCIVVLCIYFFSNWYINAIFYFTLCVYFINLVFGCAIDIYRMVQKCNNIPLEYPTLMLTLAGAFIVMYLPSVISDIARVFYNVYFTPLIIISQFMVALNPVVNLIILSSLKWKSDRSTLLPIHVQPTQYPANAQSEQWSVNTSAYNNGLTNAYSNK